MDQAYDCLPRLPTTDQEARRKIQITRDAVALYKSRGGRGEPDQKTKDAFTKEAIDNHVANTEKLEKDRLDRLCRHEEQFKTKLRVEAARPRVKVKDEQRQKIQRTSSPNMSSEATQKARVEKTLGTLSNATDSNKDEDRKEGMEQQQRSKVEQSRLADEARRRPMDQEHARKTGEDQDSFRPTKKPQKTMATAATGNTRTKTATVQMSSKVPEASSRLRNELKNDGGDEEDFVLTRHPIETGYFGGDDSDSQGKVCSLRNPIG